MRIYHLTSPARALAIVNSGIFYPASRHPLNNDNGLNCFSYRPGYRIGQCFGGEGARVILEWSGPVAVTHPDTSPPLQPNVLHDQHPWRCFVRGGSSSGFLRIVAVYFEKGALDSLVAIPFWHRYLPKLLANALYRRCKLNFLLAFRAKFRTKLLCLGVAG